MRRKTGAMQGISPRLRYCRSPEVVKNAPQPIYEENILLYHHVAIFLFRRTTTDIIQDTIQYSKAGFLITHHVPRDTIPLHLLENLQGRVGLSRLHVDRHERVHTVRVRSEAGVFHHLDGLRGGEGAGRNKSAISFQKCRLESSETAESHKQRRGATGTFLDALVELSRRLRTPSQKLGSGKRRQYSNETRRLRPRWGLVGHGFEP